MLKHSFSLLIILFSAFAAFSQQTENSTSFPQIFDIIDARNYCDRNALDHIEGIWIYPEDDVTVLIKKDRIDSEKYNIIAVDAKSNHFRLGETIGHLSSTTDPKKYKMKLFTTRKRSILTNPRQCALTLSNDDYAMRVQASSVKITFHPLYLLSRFWRVVYASYKNPAADLPIGMKKIYPSYDDNGSSRFNPTHL